MEEERLSGRHVDDESNRGQEKELEMRRNWRKRWFLKRMVLGFAVAAIAAPVAQAVPDEGGGAGQSSGVLLPNGTVVDNQWSGYHQSAAPEVIGVGYGYHLVPDGRAALTNEIVRGAEPAPSLYDARAALTNEIVRGAEPAPSLYDARAALTNEIVRSAEPAPVREPMGSTVRGEFVKSNPLSPVSSGAVVQTGDGFDWGDAGIGAGVLFALMLTLAGASLAVRHSGTQSGGTAAA
jgi:hypothetical protein